MADSLFITFEGIESCGKSTQVRLLANSLQHRGIQVYTTKEPGGTIVGMDIRNILLDSTQSQLDSATELFLFLADRALHVNEVVKPALCLSISGESESSGRLSLTLLTLSLISFVAASRSIEVLNSILIVALPFSEVESIFFMPSAPPITSSNISTISLEIISAEAP